MSFRRKKYLRPRRITGIKPYVTYDRTPGFDGDAYMLQIKDFQSFGLNQRAFNTYYQGVVINGSTLGNSVDPEFVSLLAKFQYYKVVRTTIKAQFNNIGTTSVNCGVLQLPLNTLNAATINPIWTANRSPMEEPRNKSRRLASFGAGSANSTTVVMSGTILSCAGDKTAFTAGETNVDTTTPQQGPEFAWGFYVYAGNQTVQGNPDTTQDPFSTNVAITSWRTLKFWGRKWDRLAPG